MKTRFLSWKKALICTGLLALAAPVFAAPSSTTSSADTRVAAPTQGVLSGGTDATNDSSIAGIYETAIIERVSSGEQKMGDSGKQIETYHVRFLSGPFKEQGRDIASEVGSNPYGLQPREGDKVVVFLQPGPDGQWQFFLESYDRRNAMVWLIILFVATLVVLSGWQGFKVSASIFISIALIGYVLIPLFLKGVNPVPVAIILGGVLTLISTGFSTGFNRKSYVTVIGTMGGACVAYLISLAFSDWSHLSGVSTEEDRLFFEKNPLLDPRGLLFAGIIIASVGIVEDVAVSIASGVSEVRRMNHRASFRDLFRSGMVIGNDHMGALANTLVFAYVGASLSTLLLYKQFGGSWLKFMNFDAVVDEIIRSLAGTIGLAFTVPITALLSAWIMHRHHHAHALTSAEVKLHKHEDNDV